MYEEITQKYMRDLQEAKARRGKTVSESDLLARLRLAEQFVHQTKSIQMPNMDCSVYEYVQAQRRN